MKLLHVIPSVSLGRGGPSIAVRAMTQALAQAGHEVHLATTDDDTEGRRLRVPLASPVVEQGVTVWYFPRQTTFYTVSAPLTRWLARHVADYDVVHIHALFSYATLPAALFARRAGVPYVVRPLGTLNRWGVTHRRPLLKRLSLRFVERPILAGAACVHYTSQQEREEAEALGVRTPATVIPLGIDVEPYRCLPDAAPFFERYPQAIGRTLVLFLSRFDPKKGLPLLLDAFALVRERHADAMLVLAGDGPEPFVQTLQEQSRRLHLGEHIVWTGFLKGQEKLQALAAADLFVLPSYSENFGIAVVEAMAAGLPVLVSDQVGIHREIEEAGAGWVSTCSVPAIAEQLDLLLSDHTLRQSRAIHARHLAFHSFSQPAMTRALGTFYHSLVHPELVTSFP